MDARARARVRESARANETYLHYGKYTENCRADPETETFVERARWLTLTRVPGSVWPIVSLL